jgi:hypothetical protein
MPMLVYRPRVSSRGPEGRGPWLLCSAYTDVHGSAGSEAATSGLGASSLRDYCAQEAPGHPNDDANTFINACMSGYDKASGVPANVGAALNQMAQADGTHAADEAPWPSPSPADAQAYCPAQAAQRLLQRRPQHTGM